MARLHYLAVAVVLAIVIALVRWHGGKEAVVPVVWGVATFVGWCGLVWLATWIHARANRRR